jgi:hypothetical protein
VELADLIGFLSGEEGAAVTFRLEDMAAKFLWPLEHRLRQAGVVFEQETPRLAGPRRDDPGPASDYGAA